MNIFALPPRVIGVESVAEAAQVLGLGARDLLLTNEYIYDLYFKDKGIACLTLFQEEYGFGEPTDAMVDGILAGLGQLAFDRIIAVGGGTILDIAKLLAVADGARSVEALYGNARALKKTHTLVAIPTTCGTGAEVTNIAVVNRTRLHTKDGLVSPELYADCAVLVPELLDSLPYKVFATTSMDALIHAAEAYLSPQASPLSDMFAEKALQLILRGYRLVAGRAADVWKDYAPDFLTASNIAGAAFSNAGCAAVHALGYPLGSRFHIPHGEANQVLFAPVLRKYEEKCPQGKLFALKMLLANLLDCRMADAFERLFELMDGVLVRKAMHNYGVTEQDIGAFVPSVLESQQRLLRNNYTELTEKDMLAIYRSAF
ncbi:iron-containing alcohol dehydrogenase [Intestinibacillus massiliensis]|uniref:iron-containing alcohol dehydrogenase n=1 Tax=Intestinibacillus massiliensis TaxID=1871029 RepID=UPI000B353B17|nr:iron-containing alcohol dehydrogenase [Intestinibacillus massiliensis]